MSASKHAKHSPSKLEELEVCCRFKRVESDNPNNDAASEGTDMHSAYETADLRGLDEEQKNQVEKCLMFTESLKAQRASFGPVTELKEYKLTIPDLTWGFADRVLIAGTHGDVLDAKFGRKPVTPAEHNFQVHAYVTALFLANPGLQTVTGHIVAPRTLDGPDSFDFDRSIVEQTESRIKALYERIEDPFSPPTPDNELCAMCSRAARCPAIHPTMALAATRMVTTTALELPSTLDLHQLSDPADCAKAQALAGLFMNWADQIRLHNVERALTGVEIPGFKLIKRSTGARVPSDQSPHAIETLLKAGVTQEQIHGAVTLRLPELAKIRSFALGIPESEAKETLKGLLADCLVEGSTAFLQAAKRASPKKLAKGKGGETQDEVQQV